MECELVDWGFCFGLCPFSTVSFVGREPCLLTFTTLFLTLCQRMEDVPQMIRTQPTGEGLWKHSGAHVQGAQFLLQLCSALTWPGNNLWSFVELRNCFGLKKHQM
jgi:hypothetical protein